MSNDEGTFLWYWFDRGNLLWYWYDSWIILPALAIAGALTLLLIARRPWTGGALVMKAIAFVALVPTAVLALDRLGMRMSIGDDETLGYASIVGAVIAFGIGGIDALFLQRRSRRAELAGQPVGTSTSELEDPSSATGTVAGPGATQTQIADASPPDTGTAATMAVPAGDGTATVIVGGAAATQMASAPGTPRATLRATKGPREGEQFDLESGETTIGRSSDNAIVLDDPTISRRHATIATEGDTFVVEDQGSTSGTYVSGNRLSQKTVLDHGAALRFGETEFVFEVPTAAGSPPAGAPTVMAGTPAPSDRTAALPKDQAPPAGDAAGATVVLGREETPQAVAWLLVRKGAEAGRSFDLSADSTSIGHGADSSVRLEDNAVSGSHALVKRDAEGRYLLYDVGSRNGTRIGGQALAGASLRDGSRIVAGQSEIAFTEVEGGEVSQPEPAGDATVVMGRQASTPSRGVLLVRTGPSAGSSAPIPEDGLVVGQDPGAGGLVVNDSSVSRRHALVRGSKDEGYSVFDLGSTNGTEVDGTRLAGHELTDGDVIEVGTTELQFVKPASS